MGGGQGVEEIHTLLSAVTCALSYFNLDLVVFITDALPFLVCTKHAPQPSLYAIQHTSFLSV